MLRGVFANMLLILEIVVGNSQIACVHEQQHVLAINFIFKTFFHDHVPSARTAKASERYSLLVEFSSHLPDVGSMRIVTRSCPLCWQNGLSSNGRQRTFQGARKYKEPHQYYVL